MGETSRNAPATPPAGDVVRWPAALGARGQGSIQLAVDALAAGRLAVLPTETVYGLAAAASAPAFEALLLARQRLHRAATLPGVPTAGPSTWHAASLDAVLEVVGALGPLHLRLLQRLWPGPVGFMIPMTEALGLALARRGVGGGVLDDGKHLYVRVPDQDATRAVLAACPILIGAEGIPTLGGAPARDAGAAAAALTSAAVAAAGILDAGPSTIGKPSSVIRLEPSGGWELARAGVFDRAYIERRIRKIILFVCTGNTCRSPMAAAIAAGLLAEPGAPGRIPAHALSAGVTAGDGAPPTIEGVRAVGALGYRGPAGTSKALTRQMVREADVIFAMTNAHLDGVLRLDPAAAAKAGVLDPAGRDIADPIGGPPGLYASLARSMQEMIRTRLKEQGA